VDRVPTTPTPAPNNPVEDWFTRTIGEPFGFQREAWASHAAGRSGLLHAPTGMGKTYSAWLPSLMRYAAAHPDPAAWAAAKTEPLRVLWITPLRALANDTEQTLRRPVDDLKLPWTVERRTGDVSAAVKKRQRSRLPSALVTTPESLSVLLSYADAPEKFRGLHTVVVDEWHELMSTKRGTQTELGLARLRAWNPDLRVWGLSATLGNLDEAADTLMGALPDGSARPAVFISGPDHKRVEIQTLRPDDATRFPWSGHLGLTLLEPVLTTLETSRSTLLFTNTRSQSEIWFNSITTARPDWLGEVALHHGSISRKKRDEVEQRLRDGDLRCCVCTSSLDLGVDFSPVEKVIQVASPKGVARLMQRAGRSGHQPGKTSLVIGVPTNALELLDFAAARDAAEARDIESRVPLDRPLDVLVQHLVTCALGGGFVPAAMRDEVRSAWSYRNLSDDDWAWALDFVRRGGDTLKVYPQYARVVPDDAGVYRVPDAKIARNHRMAIGTITSDSAIVVRFANGKKLGTVEESFVGFLKPGDRFVFAGHLLQLVRVRQMVATVKQARGKKAQVPRWQGGKSPLSTQLAAAVRDRLDAFRHHGLREDDPPEMVALAPLLNLQRDWSVVPARGELLIESIESRDGHHLFLFPLRGRLVHEGLGTLLAQRLTELAPRSVTVTVNDYGIELLSPEPLNLNRGDWRGLLHPGDLLDDLLRALDSSQLARRAFRDIARVAGLITVGFPGQPVANRHLQASSELFFDVFRDFDPHNLLLDQANREVLERQLEVTRLRGTLDELGAATLVLRDTERLSPLAFPLWAERLREQHLTSQSWTDRVSKMALRLEEAAGEGG